MTHAFLQSELTSLISDSKRRYNHVRTAAEQSLADLKAISVTSETQLAADLFRRPQFVDPLVLACKSKNVKLACTGTICLQRLTASKAVARARLPDVLDAFHDGIASGYEPQLKILQTLPSLLQLYASDLSGNLLARTLEICATLQSSRTAIVSNTASATFQQLVSTVFDEAGKGEKVRVSSDGETKQYDKDQEYQEASLEDALRLFDDLCLLLDQQQPKFLKVENLPSGFLLETLQLIMSTHGSFIISHANHVRACGDHLMRGLSRILSRKDAFGMLVRALSILLLIMQGFADELQDQLIQVIPSLVNALEKDGNPMWKRTLCLEFFRNVCSDFGVMRKLFELFDDREDSENLIGPLLSALVRIAAEDPSLIGLGRQSTIPVQRVNDIKSEEAASIEAQGLGGAITSVPSGDAGITGISLEWSVIHTPLMEQGEKQVPPAIPSTYIYTQALGCIASFCDGLSKFIMPLSVPSRPSRESLDSGGRDSPGPEPANDEIIRRQTRPSTSAQKYQRLINPLTLTKHPLHPQIRICATMIETCWPAALATCSTFLNSALDSEFYHILIRSVQKLAQVSGVLELSTPRDALLTTLAKASIPTNANSVISTYHNSNTNRVVSSEHDNPHDRIKSPTEPPPTPTFPTTGPALNVRHLLCLRALLNLGIALGPTLEQDAWFILIETMQIVEALIAIPTTMSASSQTDSPRVGVSSQDGQNTLAGEIAAVQAATKRMLDSTRSYSAESFAVVVQALLRLLGRTGAEDAAQLIPDNTGSPVSPTRLAPTSPAHHSSRSISGLWTKSKSLDLEIGFVLNKISELSRINIHRFASTTELSCSWNLIGSRLLRLSQDPVISGSHRIQSASILDLISMDTVKLLDDSRFETEEADQIRSRCLESLLKQLTSLGQTRLEKQEGIELEVHKRLLEALESMLSHSGESLNNSWPIALEILSLSYSKGGQGQPQTSNASIDQAERNEQHAQILRVAFRSIQLITSDFLSVLTVVSLARLAQLLRQFSSQDYDLNVALTSTTLLWSLASQVLTRIEMVDLTRIPSLDTSLDELDSSATAALWSVILLQLIQLCKDERPDVRNAAIRVLLKMFEASSESLSPSTWAITLVVGPLSAIRFSVEQYTSGETDQSAWLVSAAQLTDGIMQLITQNLKVIAAHDGFKNTWRHIMEVFEGVLSTTSLSASSLAFSNLSRILAALPALGQVDAELIVPALRIWASYHPAGIRKESQSSERRSEEVPNQPAFTSHAHVLVEAYNASPTALTSYQLGERRIVPLMMDSLERAVLFCSHPPYTSDVKSLSPEQKEVFNCLRILKTLLRDSVAEYSRYLLQLLKNSLGIQEGKIGSRSKRSAIFKSVQKPTFVAFASACLDDLRNLALEHANSNNVTETLAVPESLTVLSSLIRTKYTEIPTNHQAPLWRNATATAVVMLEVLQHHVHQNKPAKDSRNVGGIAAPAISLAFSILGYGGLSNPPAKQTEEALVEDETFDIEHFQLLHKAVISVFQHAAIKEDDCRQYAITLFNASLLAKPWYYDIPDDLAKEPLKGIMEVRQGSVHQPIFAVRTRICYTALDALFGLVQQPGQPDENSDGVKPISHKWAWAACPYLILRVVHPLKTFLADQRLRGLTPPPMPQQVELQRVLHEFVDLHSDAVALKRLTSSIRNHSHEQTRNGSSEVPNPGTDGKEHLRALYLLNLRMQKFWRGLPRLKGEGAWQTDEPGRGIEEALERWSASVGEGWGFGDTA
ncbi:uncharacterized protein Z518_11088 [Rhinocladiella mackenziei CBS 650.93]|uniref:Protein MON2 homolog n=1 Tax=Rhinocladiella mackenziei CBS 650.93 TaxID=1442369 RepID=A0A0D2I8V5_9EURO|nr:uncharacterized protein Z518_11088 [Rhinocladiella mackenziei CBS 650.93]KIW99675.1 hypothetical protein Z518_11088 [Rhinocladiella mackenziei CBS 650.93]